MKNHGEGDKNRWQRQDGSLQSNAKYEKMKIETPASKTIKMSSLNNEKYVEKYIKNRINNAKEIDRKKMNNSKRHFRSPFCSYLHII